MAFDTTTADAALKEDYQPGARKQIDDKNKLLAQVKTNEKDIEGRRAVLALHIGRSGGVGARADGGTLPTAGEQRYVEERIPVFHNYGRIKVTGPVMRATKSDKGSFVRAVKSEMDGMVKDVERQVNRQSWGTSDGKVATCGTTASSTTVTLASTTTDRQMRQLYKNLLVDIGTVADPTAVASARKITAVSRANKTITISGAAVSTTDGTHFVFVAGNGGASGGAGQKEITGVQTIVKASGTLFNVNPTNDPEWVSTVDGNSGTNRPFTERLVTKNMNAVDIECGAEVDLLFSSEGVFGAAEVHLATKRRTLEPVNLQGGHKGIKFSTADAEAALTWDRDCPENQLYGFTKKNLVHFVMSPWEWMDDDGSVLSRVQNEDAYEATFYKDHELATDLRAAHLVIQDVTEA